MNTTKLFFAIALSLVSSALFAADPMLELVPVRAKKTGKVITVVVVTVRPDSPAEKAGIREGMFITSIHGMKVAGKTEKELIDETSKIKWPKDNILLIECSNRLSDKKVTHYSVKIPKPEKLETLAKL